MQELIERQKDVEEINQMSPLTWAYIGDSVYELFIRTHLVNTTGLKPHNLHIEAIKYVKANSQKNILSKIHDDLTEEEKGYCKTRKKADNHHLPKMQQLKNINIQQRLKL